MIDVGECLKKGLEVQHLDLEPKDVPFNIYMKHNGDILKLCFLEMESNDALIVSETTSRGTEEIRIVPKINISYIGIFYDFTGLEEKKYTDDKMII